MHAHLTGQWWCGSPPAQLTETHAPCAAFYFVACSLVSSVGSTGTSASQRQVYPHPIHALRLTALTNIAPQFCMATSQTSVIKHHISPAPDSHEPQPGLTMKLAARARGSLYSCAQCQPAPLLSSTAPFSHGAPRPPSTHPCVRLRCQRTRAVRN